MKTLEKIIHSKIKINTFQPRMTQPGFPIVRPQKVDDIGGIQVYRNLKNKNQARAIHFRHAVTIAFSSINFDTALNQIVRALAYLESVQDLSTLPKKYQRYKPVRPLGISHDEMMTRLAYAERRGLQFARSDGGREAAGFENGAPDCFARAICHHTSAQYQEVYDTIYHGDINNRPENFVYIGIEKYNLREVWSNYLISRKPTEWQRNALGWDEQFVWKKISASRAYKIFGNCIVRNYNHAAAIVDGVLLDTFDSRKRGVQSVYKQCSEEEAQALRAKGAALIE